MSDNAFSLPLENTLITDLAKEMYEDCQAHASRRHLEPDYVIEKFLSEFSKLARKDGVVK